MKQSELQDFLSGNDEVELTDELIETLVRENEWRDAESLKKLRDEGAKWNKKRKSIVFTDII